MTLRAPRALAAAVALAACSSDPPGVCDGVSRGVYYASAEGRWLLGLASRFPADTALASRRDELLRSQRARRAAAWRAVAQAFAPVPLAQPVGGATVTVPRFRTWYDREDVARTFQRLYGALSPAARRAQERFSDAALDDALGWNTRFVTTLPEWDSARLARFAAGFDTPLARASITGLQRIGMSPDVVRHAIQSYPEVLRCINERYPARFVDGPAAPQQLAREPIALPTCGAQRFGAYFVASGGTLTARVEGGDPEARVAVFDGVAQDATARCTAAASEGCTVQGPGTFSVRVSTLGRPSGGTLDVRATPPGVDLYGCLRGAFPAASATVAMEWRRAGIGLPFPVYDTSEAGLRRRLAPGATATWGEGDGTAEPDANGVYTMRTASGSVFRLAAMHLRTREVDQWLNITLWWSPTPDTDFGADRPAELRALGAPWSNYKMCVAMDFAEYDPDPAGGYGATAPTLAASLRATHEGLGGPSWCSNPYIDAGPGLVRSNCVGCHQHALSGVRPADVQNTPRHYPSNGRTRVRNNYPADGFWGFDAGDNLGAVFAETADFYRNAP